MKFLITIVYILVCLRKNALSEKIIFESTSIENRFLTTDTDLSTQKTF